MFPQFGYPTNDNNVVLHRHGGLQAASSDGAPNQNVAPGGTRTNHYPNSQAAAPLWYHDHADMVTSFNVYAGLAGSCPTPTCSSRCSTCRPAASPRPMSFRTSRSTPTT